MNKKKIVIALAVILIIIIVAVILFLQKNKENIQINIEGWQKKLPKVMLLKTN